MRQSSDILAKNTMKKNKKVIKKKVSKKAVKKIEKVTSHELVVRVQNPVIENKTPTLEVLEPMREGKKMALSPTWISSAQLIKIVQKTPAEHIYKRPGKGGQVFQYVTGNYVEKVLNFVFAWNWDFEIVEHGKEGNQVWVKGKLTVKSQKGETITKSQFGRADIKFMKGSTTQMVDFGNDLKAATTDSLKKCASLLGIASDIYGKQEYKQEANVEIKDVVVITKEDTVAGPDGDPVCVCKACDEIIDETVANFSKKMYGKTLCRECQKTAKRK